MATLQSPYKLSKAFDQQIQDLSSKQADMSVGYDDNTVAYTAARLIDATDMGKFLYITTAGAINVTLQSDANAPGITIGQECEVMQAGAGLITFLAGGGATVNKAVPTLKTLGQWSRCKVKKVAANTWVVNGDLALV
jgi:hypothetical protein